MAALSRETMIIVIIVIVVLLVIIALIALAATSGKTKHHTRHRHGHGKGIVPHTHVHPPQPHSHAEECNIPVAPHLNCLGWAQGDNTINQCGMEDSGGPTGSHFIQWFQNTEPNFPVIEYKIYGKNAFGTVTTTDNDVIYTVPATDHYYITPDIGASCWSFIVTAVNACGESEPSRVFNSYCF